MSERKATKAEFSDALRNLVDDFECHSVDTGDIIVALKAQIVSLRQELLPSRFDDAYNAKHGLAPMTEMQIREALKLEPYEPIPPQRRG